MSRRKLVKNESRDYLQSSLYGILSLSSGLWLINNYQSANPYLSVAISAVGLEAFRRWNLAQAVGEKVSNIGVASQQVFRSSVTSIFSAPDQAPLDPDVFRVQYRKSKQMIGVHKDNVSIFLNEGFNRQLQKTPAPFSMNKFNHVSPRSVWCIWWLVGRCGQFTTTGQGTSPTLVTIPHRAIGYISHIWPRLSAS